MNPRMTMVLLLIFGIILGFTGTLALNTTGSNPLVQAPAGHQQIISLITIQDNTFVKTLEPVLIRSGETKPLSMIPLSFSGSVSYSFWEFRSDKVDASTVLATCMIWGPGSADEYFVEIGRLSGNAYALTYPGGSTTWTYGGNDGFIYFLYG